MRDEASLLKAVMLGDSFDDQPASLGYASNIAPSVPETAADAAIASVEAFVEERTAPTRADSDGASSVAHEQMPRRPKVTNAPGFALCPNCGDVVDATDKFCKSCGAPIQ